MTIQIHEWAHSDAGATCRYCGAIKPASVFPQSFPTFCSGSRLKCASCVHDHHPHSICNGRSGGTAYRCSCTCPDARLAP